MNVGERAADEEEFPEAETYPVHQFPEITEFLHERWAGGGGPNAWVETAEGAATGSAGYFHERVAALRRRGRGCCVVAPVVLHGRAWGELYVARAAGAPVFARADSDFATVLAAVVAAGLAQTERLEEARRLAFTDALTGLANRRAVDVCLEEAVERHRAEGAVVSLVVCDLNGLKRVNDTLGHAVGDRLLERFGSVLSLCGAMVPGALVARLGGDEFCLVAVGPPADDVVKAADELCRRAGELQPGRGRVRGRLDRGGDRRGARRPAAVPARGRRPVPGQGAAPGPAGGGRPGGARRSGRPAGRRTAALARRAPPVPRAPAVNERPRRAAPAVRHGVAPILRPGWCRS